MRKMFYIILLILCACLLSACNVSKFKYDKAVAEREKMRAEAEAFSKELEESGYTNWLELNALAESYTEEYAELEKVTAKIREETVVIQDATKKATAKLSQLRRKSRLDEIRKRIAEIEEGGGDAGGLIGRGYTYDEVAAVLRERGMTVEGVGLSPSDLD